MTFTKKIRLLVATGVVGVSSGLAVAQPDAPEGVNLLTTHDGVVVFSGRGIPPLPADFFAPGSDPFFGDAILGGTALDPSTLHTTDTVIRRGLVTFPGAGFPRPSEPVPIEIIALSLRSLDPITVTFNGGQNPEQWDLRISLSDVPSLAGQLDAVAEQADGGTSRSVLLLTPRFIFESVDNPGDIRIFDMGLEGFGPLRLATATEPMALVEPADTPLSIPPDGRFGGLGTTNFYPGVDPNVGLLQTFIMGTNDFRVTVQTTPIPAPATPVLFAIAACALRRRRAPHRG